MNMMSELYAHTRMGSFMFNMLISSRYAFQDAQIGWYIEGKSDLRTVQTLDALWPHDDSFTSAMVRSTTTRRFHQLEIINLHQMWIKNSMTAAQGTESPPFPGRLSQNQC